MRMGIYFNSIYFSDCDFSNSATILLIHIMSSFTGVNKSVVSPTWHDGIIN